MNNTADKEALRRFHALIAYDLELAEMKREQAERERKEKNERHKNIKAAGGSRKMGTWFGFYAMTVSPIW